MGYIDYQSLTLKTIPQTCITFLFVACLQGNSTMWMSFLKRNYPSWLQGQAVSRPKYLHIHVASGFNSKTTELSKNTVYCEMKLIIKCLTFGDEDIDFSSSSLHSRGLHSSEQQVTCEIEFPFPCCQFWSLTFGWTLAATREGLDRCTEWDQNKTNQRIKPRCWSGQDPSPNQNTVWPFQNNPEHFWQHSICSCFDPIT